MISVLIDPSCDFSTLRDRLDGLRWHVVSEASQPILPGEPEYAVFEREAGERGTYTFNPVCRLRVLEFLREPDPETHAALPEADETDVEAWLASADERTLLRGLLAAAIWPQSQFAERIEGLERHPRRVVANAAKRASEAVSRAAPPATDGSAEARAAALAAIEIVKTQVEPLLLSLARDPIGSVAASLRPRPDDYARVFVPDAVEVARRAYDALWKETPRVEPQPAGMRLECHVAPAGMLGYDNELSWHFPGGYRAIAHLLDPHRTWVRWKYIRPGATAGMAFDGLVWCDDHWAWFPKPFRALGGAASRV